MNVLLGVCGGMAAYKAAELTRELQRRGARVQVAMTAGAEKFVTPLTFASLSGRQVLTSLWSPVVDAIASDDAQEFDIEHIRIAQEIDVVVTAPATANLLAKLAHGIADDLLTTICLATTAPLLVAPAMNINMWRHPATQQNLQLLRERGVRIVAPDAGYLACGMVGEGRLANIEEIADAVMAAAQQRNDLAGETILITAGGTREPIDPVRFLGNRSSGRMGIALAEAAHSRGAKVILIAAPEVAPVPGCEFIRITTAAEMQSAVLSRLAEASAIIMAAAVADYRVVEVSPEKLKKRDSLTLELVKNEDILRCIIKARRPDTVVIGFAAETENLLEEGHRKLREKGVDAIVANDVSSPESGFEVDRNAGVLLTRDEEIILPPGCKREMAERVLDFIVKARAQKLA